MGNGKHGYGLAGHGVGQRGVRGERKYATRARGCVCVSTVEPSPNSPSPSTLSDFSDTIQQITAALVANEWGLDTNQRLLVSPLAPARQVPFGLRQVSWVHTILLYTFLFLVFDLSQACRRLQHLPRYVGA